MFEEIISFIRVLFGSKDGFIPLHVPTFSGNEKKYLEKCIDTSFVSSVGEYVDTFERQMAAYTGSKRAIVCVNGTSALHLALKIAGVNSGDEVITQPLTFIATVNAINYTGADPVFMDVDKDTLGLSPEKLDIWLKKNLESGNLNNITKKRIAAIVPMHTFGHPCRIDEIVSIADKYNIPVVEDAAESVGSLFKERHCGTFGKLGIQSFNGNKILTTGGGGMILTNDENTGDFIKHVSTQAKVPHKWEYVHDHIGYNYRMPNINAALGVAQLEQLESFVKIKRKLAEDYHGFFKNIPGIRFFTEPGFSRSNYWLNTIILKDRDERDRFLEFTNKNAVMTRPAWRLMNKLEMFSNSICGDLSNAEWLEDRLVNLPSSIIYDAE
jgi:aminotransferase in exopolysaccharide biosynthesis